MASPSAPATGTPSGADATSGARAVGKEFFSSSFLEFSVPSAEDEEKGKQEEQKEDEDQQKEEEEAETK